MPKIPRRQKRIASAEKKPFLRPNEPIQRAKIQPDLTKAKVAKEISKSAFALADILDSRERFKADKLTTQATDVSSQLQREVIEWTSDAKTKIGNAAVGVDDYDDFYNETLSRIIKERKLEGTGVGDAVRSNDESFNILNIQKLSDHQQEQQVSAANNSVDRYIENGKAHANLFPDKADEIITKTIDNINTVSEIIGDEESEAARQRAEVGIKEDMIMRISLDDIEQGEELFSTHRATLPKESVKTIEQEMKRIKKQNELNIKKAEAKAQEDWLNDFNKRTGTANPPTISDIDNAPISETLRRSLKKEAINAPGNFEKTDPIIYASFSSAIDLNPDSLTSEDIWDKAGKGVSTADAEKLAGRLTVAQDKGIKANDKSPVLKNAKSILGFARKDGKFADDPQENDLAWARTEAALDAQMEKDPDTDPVEFVEKLLIPAQKGFVKSTVDFFTINPVGAELPVVDDKPERLRSIQALKDVDAPLTEANISEAHRQLTEEAEPKKKREAPGLEGL